MDQAYGSYGDEAALASKWLLWRDVAEELGIAQRTAEDWRQDNLVPLRLRHGRVMIHARVAARLYEHHAEDGRPVREFRARHPDLFGAYGEEAR